MNGRWLLALLILPAFAGCLDGSEGETLAHGLAPVTPPGPKPVWADIDAATIRPGTPIQTAAGDCATNFVFTRPDNGTVFIGTSAFCVRELPVGSLGTFGSETVAVLIYNSWHTMADLDEADPDAREYNDFAVFAVDSSSRKAVHPAHKDFGGPIGMADMATLNMGSRVFAFANHTIATLSTPLGAAPTRTAPEPPTRHDAIVTGRVGTWGLLAQGAPPALPGNLGGAVVTPDGLAVGILVNLGVTPSPGANGIARLDAVMAYAEEHANLRMTLATWDVLNAPPL